MEDESVNIIRETKRNLLKYNRRFQRDQESDNRRCVDKICISADTITDIANKLKTKSSISISELRTLKNGLLEDPKYIETVLNIHGALRGIVRELTGHEVGKQVEAAGCLCNLAMGDARAGLSLAKTAGAYLVASVDNCAVELAVPSIWAVGNMAAANPCACAILVSQGALSKLCAVLTCGDEDVRQAAMYTATHCCYVMMDDLRSEHLTKILEAISKLEITMSASQLLFILSCHKEFTINLLTEEYFKNILEQFQICIKDHNSYCCLGTKVCCKLIYLTRTLANIQVSNAYCEMLTSFIVENALDSIRVVLSKDSVVREAMLWLLGNLYNWCNDNVVFVELIK